MTSALTTLQTWTSNITSNVSNSIPHLTLRDYIRLVWIIGGYIFLRPYLDKAFRKLLESHTDKTDAADAAAEREARKAKLSANALRGIIEDDDGDEGEGSDEDGDEGGKSTAVPQWGKSARRKQQKFFLHLEQEAERRKNEDEDDLKDIADLLED
ncbi:hypothetical protein AJ80_07972 [Polytolypa hystricis UAMH7299]|uniref:Processing of GAS1 and ALP protein 2 n=1 Tax=Polytolypa hystricis (strain UAMH7299) TaxID=1447883 RepID=A0A2B7XFQ9_POLH7|nr:hypothetical protein AJ80_07972 [Polytolypa hystricis UAMH7299]